MNKTKPNELGAAMADYIFDYLPVKKGVSANTVEAYTYTIGQFIRFLELDCGLSREKLDIGHISREKVEMFLDWLDTYTFRTEARFEDTDYARRVYRQLARELIAWGTTRVAMFSSRHTDATLILMEELENAGVTGYVGKVNMDRSSGPAQEGTEESVRETLRWLENCHFAHIKPILTPRFTPSCSDGLLEALGKLAAERNLPVQSHLSENTGEITWVRELHPDCGQYWETYAKYGLWNGRTVMAHCVYSTEEEVLRMKKNRVYIAHCPQSNVNLSSGIAPVRRYLELGLSIGLGTDLAGGANLSMFRCITDAIAVSKLYWRLVDQDAKPLTLEEGFYLATVGGGSFFGNVGSFEKGYEADVLIGDDQAIPRLENWGIRERLARFLYLSGEKGQLVGKYVAGEKIF